MAIRIFNKYSPRANAPDSDYPEGSIKNETVVGANDGTPLDQDWANDYEGFTAALLDDAGVTPSGLPDTLNASDRLNALKTVISNEVPLASTTVAGRIQIATSPEAQTGTDNTKAITPLTLKEVTDTKLAPDASTTVKGIIRIATQAETDAGTSQEIAITPLTFKTLLESEFAVRDNIRYPVGTRIMREVNPSTIGFPGTWTLLGNDYALISRSSFGAINESGNIITTGSTNQHALDAAEMEHYHPMGNNTGSNNGEQGQDRGWTAPSANYWNWNGSGGGSGTTALTSGNETTGDVNSPTAAGHSHLFNARAYGIMLWERTA